MARPRKRPEDQRTKVLSVRLTPSEYARVTAMAKDAGMLAGVYARKTILDKRPRSKPANTLLFEKLLYELHSISTNFNQLHDATGDSDYLKLAKYIGGHLPEQLIGRNDLAELIEAQLPHINTAGHSVNDLAYKANAGISFTAQDKEVVISGIKAAVAPLDKASAG